MAQPNLAAIKLKLNNIKAQNQHQDFKIKDFLSRANGFEFKPNMLKKDWRNFDALINRNQAWDDAYISKIAQLIDGIANLKITPKSVRTVKAKTLDQVLASRTDLDPNREDELFKGFIQAGKSQAAANALAAKVNYNREDIGVSNVKISYDEGQKSSYVVANVNGRKTQCTLNEQSISFNPNSSDARRLAAQLAVQSGATGIKVLPGAEFSLQEKK
ncbi:hypothetical protein [Piscirickettsia litoralis]|uniref:Uncharacterized protein n=1 Tax=Piscirickettsia litoralis TaxID=1891921 RepID=A0ABX3A4R2_9GAMM|nr:hypothetical protein [Piscirickettsia litoralis]ODN43849.1 hypothetical protein BGC07_14325 [Piscirickettsia litoralis]